jgi:hypothetical protein
MNLSKMGFLCGLALAPSVTGCTDDIGARIHKTAEDRAALCRRLDDIGRGTDDRAAYARRGAGECWDNLAASEQRIRALRSRETLVSEPPLGQQPAFSSTPATIAVSTPPQAPGPTPPSELYYGPATAQPAQQQRYIPYEAVQTFMPGMRPDGTAK